MWDIQKLIKKAGQGNPEAFGKIYAKFLDKIYRFVFFRTGKKEDAEDLTEQIFIKIWEGLRKYKQNQVPFEAWIFRIARNHIIDYYRKNKNHTSLDSAKDLKDGAVGPERIVERKMMHEEVLEKMKLLPGSYQEIIILKFIEEKENTEISAILRKPKEHVRVLQSRALKALRKVMENGK